MREITVKVYDFNELSAEAKEKAVENYRQGITEFWWADEALASLKAFAEHFGSKLQNWEIDFWNNSRSWVRFAEVDEISDEELKELIESMGSYNKDTMTGNGDCKLTGVCYDEDICDGARIAYYKDGVRAIETLLDAGFDSWLKAVHAETEYERSEEAIVERLTEDDYEFTEDGTVCREK